MTGRKTTRKPTPATGAYGAVEGHAAPCSADETWTLLLDDMPDGPGVRCYLDAAQAAMFQRACGKRVLVEGWVEREPNTGHPSAIRTVSTIAELPDRAKVDFRAARGAAPPRDGDPLPEEAIRRLRDA